MISQKMRNSAFFSNDGADLYGQSVRLVLSYAGNSQER